MSNVENITKVYLLNTPLENDYKHTLYFGSAEAQREYFESKIKPGLTFTNFSYQRKDNTIRIPKHFDEVYKCNYVMYQNSYYSNKWFYAFIIDCKYENEDVTTITIETDVIQTYLFDYTFKDSFVEREHVDDDTLGLHTIPENVEMGEYICNYKTSYPGFTNLNLVIGVSEKMDKIPTDTNFTTEWSKIGISSRYYGTYSGISYYGIPWNDSLVSEVQWILNTYAKNGKNDAIVTMFIAPKEVSETNQTSTKPTQFVEYAVKHSGKCYKKEFSIDRTLSSLDGYKPKNHKLYCYPYKYLIASNNNGASAVYQWEHFNDDKPLFELNGTLTPGCSIRLIPKNYKDCAINDEEGLNLGKFPICNWTSDEYTNWLTQNGVNIGINMVSGVGQIIAGIGIAVGSAGVGTAVGGSSIVSGVSTIANQLGQIHQMSFTPPQAHGNTNNGDIITASSKNTFTFYGMTIKDEYLKIIDEYFSMFGYKINRVKIPNKNHRENYWFTKTIDCNILGDIPNKELLKIKDCYNKGITFWKNPENIKDYSVSNQIN